jgi:hypothetical protein
MDPPPLTRTLAIVAFAFVLSRAIIFSVWFAVLQYPTPSAETEPNWWEPKLVLTAPGFGDSLVTTHTERAAGYLPEEPVFGADTFVEEAGSGVEILEAHDVGVLVVLTGILFRVPCSVERV